MKYTIEVKYYDKDEFKFAGSSESILIAMRIAADAMNTRMAENCRIVIDDDLEGTSFVDLSPMIPSR